MNNDIIPQRPPRQPNDEALNDVPAPTLPPEVNLVASQQPEQPASPVVAPVDSPTDPSIASPEATTPQTSPGQSPPPKKPYIRWALGSLATILLLCLALFAWYTVSLRPVSSDKAARVNVSIVSGSTPSQIGELLQEKKVIRSKAAFAVYTRIHDVHNKLQAGSFSLSPADSTGQVVDSLISGEAEQFDITFYPGATLNGVSDSEDKTPSHRQVLQKLGYTDDEITEAFDASYVADYPLLFSDKPETANLEGYIYGETYRIASGSTVKQILMRTFDEFESKIQQANLVEQYKKQGLTLYEGITLASIIQREVAHSEDQKQVAQVFYNRLAIDMQLGADATFVYAASQLGVAPSVDLDSPYNTRKYNGLPPGPIASPGLGALQAAAAPADGDYLYFVSGDDGKNHFSHTLEEHEAKTAEYCKANCSLF